MATNAQMQAIVQGVLEQFMRLVSTRDMGVLLDFAPGDDVLLVGSDLGEIACGASGIRDFFERMFNRTSTFSWEADSIDVAMTGDIAWFFADGEMTVTGPEGQEKGPYRISGVLQRFGDQWLWRQYHGSEPVE